MVVDSCQEVKRFEIRENIFWRIMLRFAKLKENNRGIK
jgi:hypothetical protein